MFRRVLKREGFWVPNGSCQGECSALPNLFLYSIRERCGIRTRSLRNSKPGTFVNEMSTLENRLVEAAMKGNLTKLRQLVAEGADVNFANQLGVTALMVAAQWNRSEIVDFLLSKRADVEAVEHSSGCNALMFACLSANPEVVSLLLTHGARVNSTNSYGRTALMTAAFCGSIEVVRVLLKHGADINAMDPSGATALTQASMLGHRDVVNLLISNGANRERSTVNSMKQRVCPNLTW